ncbi:MAG: hypothetical protein JO222_03025 [Frankiales bacterium]|nr:hypothetical protein [Frankiales bacterium]
MAISPTGRRLAYDVTTARGNTSTYIARTDGSVRHLLYGPGQGDLGGDYVWSADGSSFIHQTVVGGKRTLGLILARPGSKNRRIPHSAGVFQPSPRPDGGWLVGHRFDTYAGHPSTSCVILRMHDGLRRQVAPNCGGPVWRPNTWEIAAGRVIRNGGQDSISEALMVYDVRKRAAHVLPQTQSASTNGIATPYAWNHNGAFIYYLHITWGRDERSATYHLMRIRPDGSGKQNVTPPRLRRPFLLFAMQPA